jgi:cytoplasmic iron level regulating protein YaaA (DUF328/UPF0246 family)
MKIILSPAKKLDFNKYGLHIKNTVPTFIKQTEELLEFLKNKKASEIGELMKLSPSLSSLNYDRFQNFNTNKSQYQQNIFVFNGEVYAGLDAETFTAEDMDFASDNLRVLSGLYGILKPGDIIQPYRLEMGTRLKFKNNKNLYDFWGDKISNFLNKEEHNLIINLASNEYNKAAKLKALTATVITPNFKEFKNGDYKTIMVYAKRARGMMARWIIQKKITDAQFLKNFTEDGYLYNEELSTEYNWIFTR